MAHRLSKPMRPGRRTPPSFLRRYDALLAAVRALPGPLHNGGGCLHDAEETIRMAEVADCFVMITYPDKSRGCGRSFFAASDASLCLSPGCAAEHEMSVGDIADKLRQLLERFPPATVKLYLGGSLAGVKV